MRCDPARRLRQIATAGVLQGAGRFTIGQMRHWRSVDDSISIGTYWYNGHEGAAFDDVLLGGPATSLTLETHLIETVTNHASVRSFGVVVDAQIKRSTCLVLNI